MVIRAINQVKKASNKSRPAFQIFVRLRICLNFKRLTIPVTVHKSKLLTMKKFLFLLLAGSLMACNNHKKTEKENKEIKDSATAATGQAL